MDWLRENPGITFGIHLTVISDSFSNMWRPLTDGDKVPSLVDETGYFYKFDRMAEFLAQVNFNDLETEFRAQIEAVLAANLKPTHIDWHSLRIAGRIDIFDLMVGLAKEYGLAMRVRGQQVIERVQSLGLPTNDYDFLDSSGLEIESKPATFAQLLRELPEGLSEWAIHPGVDSAELRAIEPTGNGFRQTDYEFWSTSEAREVMAREGIVLLNYEPLQEVWRRE